MTTPAKRRRLTVEDKLRILEEAQQPGVQIADLCRRHGIATSQFYGWRERAKQGAKAALAQPPGRKGRRGAETEVARLRSERDRWKGVAAELTAENLELRKNA
jgi:transposase-like protein